MPKFVSFVKYWLPVIAWIGVIFVGSGDLMSAEHTSRFIGPVMRWLIPDIAPETIGLIQFCIRKAAHLIEYAILVALLWRALFQGTNLKWRRGRVFAGVLLTCVLVAAGDEFHQSFVESRGASPWDVAIDGSGAVFGMLICWRMPRRARIDKQSSKI